MNKKIISLLPAIFVIIILGAGCSPITNNESKKGDGSTNNKTGNQGSGEITIDVEAPGNNQALITWESSVEMNEDDRFVIVYSKNKNPVHNKVNYWWKQYYTVREAEWNNLPTGTLNFRICVLKNDECVMYSNNAEVDVK